MIIWLSEILPLEQITQICQKVYFAVDDYTEVNFVVATGCLTWLFAEYAIATGQSVYREYSRQCHDNLQKAITRLSLLLPATTEVIAALVVGVSRQTPQLAKLICPGPPRHRNSQGDARLDTGFRGVYSMPDTGLPQGVTLVYGRQLDERRPDAALLGRIQDR